jgi:hypothetical protein
MNRIAAGIVAGALVSLAGMGGAFAQQQPGQVGSGPPEDIFLTATLAADGGITLSQSEFKLAWGGYYRFNFECPADGIENEAGIAFSVDGLWPNSHIRLISVSDSTTREQRVPEINFHLQGLQVGMIECEGLAAAARVSFHPMRKGSYAFTVLNDTVDPPVEASGSFVVE